MEAQQQLAPLLLAAKQSKAELQEAVELQACDLNGLVRLPYAYLNATCKLTQCD
jgi:hypothetical protein